MHKTQTQCRLNVLTETWIEINTLIFQGNFILEHFQQYHVKHA